MEIKFFSTKSKIEVFVAKPHNSSISDNKSISVTYSKKF